MSTAAGTEDTEKTIAIQSLCNSLLSVAILIPISIRLTLFLDFSQHPPF